MSVDVVNGRRLGQPMTPLPYDTQNDLRGVVKNELLHQIAAVRFHRRQGLGAEYLTTA